MDGTMQMIAVMQEFGWTYDQYMSTPNYVIQLILEKLRMDRKEQEIASRKHRGQ